MIYHLKLKKGKEYSKVFYFPPLEVGTELSFGIKNKIYDEDFLFFDTTKSEQSLGNIIILDNNLGIVGLIIPQWIVDNLYLLKEDEDRQRLLEDKPNLSDKYGFYSITVNDEIYMNGFVYLGYEVL